METVLIKNAMLVNEGEIVQKDLLIHGTLIHKIADFIDQKLADNVIDARGLHLMPGWIDDQVHFREPGLTHKATIASESRAAVAGGITSFFEMPNTNPQTTSSEALAEKFEIASKNSIANYSFLFGGTNDNLKEIISIDKSKIPGFKLFLGSSTGNMLIDDAEVLREIFSNIDLPIAVHCEDEVTIKENLSRFIA